MTILSENNFSGRKVISTKSFCSQVGACMQGYYKEWMHGAMLFGQLT